jgi:hypothetical protein
MFSPSSRTLEHIGTACSSHGTGLRHQGESIVYQVRKELGSLFLIGTRPNKFPL